MSSFLSAAENVARQRQKRSAWFEKKMEEESRAVKLAFESHILFIFGLCCTGKNVSITVRQLYLYFGTIVTLLSLDSVVSLSLMTRWNYVISRTLVNKPLEYPFCVI